MLQQLVVVTQDHMAPYFRSLVSDIVNALADKNGTLKLQALVFLRLVATEMPLKTVQKEIPVLVESVAPCIDEEWYKLVAEALRVISVFANSLVKQNSEKQSEIDGIEDINGCFKTLFIAAFKRFAENDIDQ